MSKSFLRILPLAAATLGVSSATVFGTVVRTQNFDNLAATSNWVGLNNQTTTSGITEDFGFSSNNVSLSTNPTFTPDAVGQPATDGGEMGGSAAGGGTIARGGASAVRAYYADDVGALTFRDAMTFSGRLIHTGSNTVAYLGYFNDAAGSQLTGGGAGRLANFMGFQIQFNSSGPAFYPYATDNSPGEPLRSFADTIVNTTPQGRGTAAANINEFSFTYTPGADGPDAGTYPDTYRITANVNGFTFDSGVISANADNFNLDFNRFGLHNYQLGAGAATFAIDDLQYTALTAIPEPGSLGLVGAAGLMMLRRRRQSA